jgi:excisionase family DNA binding protein
MEKRELENTLEKDILEEEFLTTDEVANILRFNARYVTILINRGDLKAVKVGKCWRIPASALREYIIANFSSKKRAQIK